jgi:MYND finger
MHGKADPTGKKTHGLEFLLKKCDKGMIQIVRYAILTKMDKQTPRPYFSVDELNELEKELGIGIFGKSQYKCGGCGKPRTEVKLFPCSKCRRIWYCGRACQVADWKEDSAGHKNRCGDKWRSVPCTGAKSSDWVDAMAAQGDGRVHMFSLHLMDDGMIAYCTDEKTGKRFNGLTDQPIYSE